MPINATAQHDVNVGRVRESLLYENGLELFVCGDQLLRGAALNAVLIAEVVLRTVPGAPEPEPLPADTTVQGTSPPTRVFGMPVLTVLAAAAAAGFFAGRRVGRA